MNHFSDINELDKKEKKNMYMETLVENWDMAQVFVMLLKYINFR